MERRCDCRSAHERILSRSAKMEDRNRILYSRTEGIKTSISARYSRGLGGFMVTHLSVIDTGLMLPCTSLPADFPVEP